MTDLNMAAKRTLTIILLVVGALGAGLLAYLLNVKTVEVYDGVTATVIFGSLSEAETERLLALAEKTDDDDEALTLVTFAYTHHDGGLKGDLLLAWGSILLERDEFANACRVLDELVLLHAAGGLDAPERLGETLLARFDGDLVSEEGFLYATAVKLRGYCGEVSPSSLAAYDALL
ncbi:MAG TPA: hypothetical protein ENN88_04360, partial [Candidatus Coatesbacteria bacterium]|nr:hypothetical protein [Candidatus Coatesbacteria bacterium]